MSFHRSCVVLLLLTLSAMTTVLQAAGANPCEWECDEPVNFTLTPPEDLTVCEGDEYSLGNPTVDPSSGSSTYIKVGPGCSGTKTQTEVAPSTDYDESDPDASGVITVDWYFEDSGAQCIETDGDTVQLVTVLPLECHDPFAEAELTDPTGGGVELCLPRLDPTLKHTVGVLLNEVADHWYACDGWPRGPDGQTLFEVEWQAKGPGIDGDNSGDGESAELTVVQPGSYSVTFTIIDKSTDQEYCSSATLGSPETVLFEVKGWQCKTPGSLDGPECNESPKCVKPGSSVSASASPGQFSNPVLLDCDGVEHEVAAEIEHRWTMSGPEERDGEGLVFDWKTTRNTASGTYTVQFQSRFKESEDYKPCDVDTDWMDGGNFVFSVPTSAVVKDGFQMDSLNEWLNDASREIKRLPMFKEVGVALEGKLEGEWGEECCPGFQEPTDYIKVSGGLVPKGTWVALMPVLPIPPKGVFAIRIPGPGWWGTPEELARVYGTYQIGFFGGGTISGIFIGSGKVEGACDTCLTGKAGIETQGVLGFTANALGTASLWDGAYATEISARGEAQASINASLVIEGTFPGFDCPSALCTTLQLGEIKLDIVLQFGVRIPYWGVVEFSYNLPVYSSPPYEWKSGGCPN